VQMENKGKPCWLQHKTAGCAEQHSMYYFADFQWYL
jgi:hypothetical protein